MSQRERRPPARLPAAGRGASGREPAFKSPGARSPLYISKRHTERKREEGRERAECLLAFLDDQAGGLAGWPAGCFRCCGAAQVGRQCGGGRSWQSLTVCSVSTTIPPEGGREALAADSLRRVADGAERERECLKSQMLSGCRGRMGGRKVCGEIQ